MKKICMILVLCLAVMVAYGQADSKDSPIMDIKAVGLDLDIPGARTSIKAEVVLDESGNPLFLREVVFRTKVYDELGEKVYTIEGELEDMPIAVFPAWYCTVREVWWTNVWFVTGSGKVKTTDVDITIEYRGSTITLPNTGGKFVQAFVAMMLSPLGETLEGDPWGGWAFAGMMTSPTTLFGGITWLTKYMEKWVP
jgi:hypothetical protein